MFIKRLYRHSKILFVAFTVFIAAYVFINYKWGIVATPLLQYGMYSNVVHVNDTQQIYLIKANNTIINCGALSFTDKDKLQFFLQQYEMQQPVNKQVAATMSAFLPLAKRGRFANDSNDTIFTAWYKKMLSQIIAAPVTSLEVYKQRLQWNGNNFTHTGNTSKITFIVP